MAALAAQSSQNLILFNHRFSVITSPESWFDEVKAAIAGAMPVILDPQATG